MRYLSMTVLFLATTCIFAKDDYKLGPDSQEQKDVPQGKITKHSWKSQAFAGTVRDYATRKRRPLVRFFACEEDVSYDPLDTPLPDAIASGEEPFMIIGSIAGG